MIPSGRRGISLSVAVSAQDEQQIREICQREGLTVSAWIYKQVQAGLDHSDHSDHSDRTAPHPHPQEDTE